MTAVVEHALSRWGLDGAQCRLVAARENAVYHVSHQACQMALRLHRAGYRSAAELNSELAWMAHAAQCGLSVPAPVPALDGSMLCEIDGTQVDALVWLAGETMTDVMARAKPDARAALFFALGREMARLHDASDAWQSPQDFERVRWDRAGLVGYAPLWDRFWQNPALSREETQLFEVFRDAATRALRQIGASLDYGLIHADLVTDNVLVDDQTLHLIDFDDGGFGWRLFDVATSLLKQRSADDFGQLRTSLIDGYCSVRVLDLEHLDLFMALRAASYVGWNITRLHEAGGTARNARFISTARDAALRYLEGAG